MISAQCDHANDKYGLVTLQFNLFIFILRIKKLKNSIYCICIGLLKQLF